MPGNPLGSIPTNDNNTPKVETVNNKSNTEEDETENEETIQDKEGFEFQLNSPSPAERRVWESYGRHRLRPRRQPSFEHKYPSNHYTNLMVHIFIQLNIKQGLKRFVNVLIKATKSEMQKMNDKVVFHPIKGEQLTRIQNHGALEVLMFLKQKRCENIKDRAVADRLKQRSGSKKSDVTSPTAATESVLVTAAIYATKDRDIAVINTPVVLLMDGMDEEVIAILENEMVDAMLEIDRKIYGKYIIYGKNEKNTCTFASAR